MYLQSEAKSKKLKNRNRRLALLLLRLGKQIGKITDHGIQVSLRREELAQMTGTTLFTISRLLSRWSEKGLVLARREAVIILDPYRLDSHQSASFNQSFPGPLAQLQTEPCAKP